MILQCVKVRTSRISALIREVMVGQRGINVKKTTTGCFIQLSCYVIKYTEYHLACHQSITWTAAHTPSLYVFK